MCRSQEIRVATAGLDSERSSFPKRYENMDSRLPGIGSRPSQSASCRLAGAGPPLFRPANENRRRRGGSEERETTKTPLDATYQEIPEPMEEGQFHRDR